MPRKTSPKKSAPSSTSDLVDQQLERYRSMRDFGLTAEPSGGAGKALRDGAVSSNLHFCVQKHAASHLHYDFRLQWNGVLKSWACAKGPSYTVADKRLAVQVEDHPIEYGGFEGVIPAGQYGGGTVMLWDQGTWVPQEGHTDVDAGLEAGNLKFTLDGEKLKGKWALIRMKGKAAKEAKPNWLLIKEHDEFERPSGEPAIVDEAQKSVITGRTMDEIAANQDHVWNSKDTTGSGQAWFRQEAPTKQVSDANKKPALHSSSLLVDLRKLPTEHQPGFIKPQLAEETESPPGTGEWLHELKLDGYRMQARKSGPTVQMLTRSGLNWTTRMAQIAEEVSRLPIQDITLDGEVVVLDADGTTNFADLQAAFQDHAKKPLTFFVFDLLHAEGHSTRGLPLRERKTLLARYLASADRERLQVSEHLETDGEAMFHKACELHAEGIVSKKAKAPYTSGRSSTWLKSKCLHEQEFVIGGWTLPGKGKTGGPGLGALLLGFYDENKRLIYAGRTGTGFSQSTSAALRKQLESIPEARTPFTALPAGTRSGVQWVTPTLVAQVRFATWTAEDQLRQAAFLGIREDKEAGSVRRERAAPTPKSTRPKHPTAPPRAVSDLSVGNLPSASARRIPIRLTHPNKIVDQESKLTKHVSSKSMPIRCCRPVFVRSMLRTRRPEKWSRTSRWTRQRH
jgi:bifunctional non-homologous end joining protein LigD